MKSRTPINNDNPWELLVLGIFFIMPAFLWLAQQGVEVVRHFGSATASGRGAQMVYEVQTPVIARVYGVMALFLGVICIRLYFRLRAK